MAYLREVEPGCDGLAPAGELRYGLEYRVEFPDGSARRYQAVISQTDFECVPIGGDKDEARRFLQPQLRYRLWQRIVRTPARRPT